MDALRSIIIDDEPLARSVVKEYLQNYPQIEVHGECNDGFEGVKAIMQYQPHLIFSVHDCLNRGYFQLARKTLGDKSVRCATYCGEFSGGWGYSRNWIEPTADLYISRTSTANDYAVKKGIPSEKSRVRGYLMLPRAHLECS